MEISRWGKIPTVIVADRGLRQRKRLRAKNSDDRPTVDDFAKTLLNSERTTLQGCKKKKMKKKKLIPTSDEKRRLIFYNCAEGLGNNISDTALLARSLMTSCTEWG